MNKNKTLVIGLIVVFIVILCAAFFIGGDSDTTSTTTGGLSNDPKVILENAQKESAAVKDTEKKAHTKIDVAKYLEYYAGTEQKLILVAREDCPYCQIAEPILQNLAYQYDFEINYLDTNEFTDETQTAFVKSDEAFQEGFGTPYLMIVQNNHIVDAIDGLVDTAHYMSFLQSYGYIKGE